MAMKQYRMRDTKENCWFGTKERTLLYKNEELAKVVAMVLDVRLGWPAGRTRAMPYNETWVQKKDDLKPGIDAKTVLPNLRQKAPTFRRKVWSQSE
jgi:hypothetical protein